MHATKAAVEEGIVPGGGVALLRAKTAVGKLTSDNADVKAGINIVLRALEAPIRQIVENAGVEGSIVVGKILENKSETYGFNAQTEEFVDMLQAGIVDPAKVVRYGPSGRSLGRRPAVTTEAMVADAPSKEAAPAMPAAVAAWAAWAAWTSKSNATKYCSKGPGAIRGLFCRSGLLWNSRRKNDGFEARMSPMTASSTTPRPARFSTTPTAPVRTTRPSNSRR